MAFTWHLIYLEKIVVFLQMFVCLGDREGDLTGKLRVVTLYHLLTGWVKLLVKLYVPAETYLKRRP